MLWPDDKFPAPMKQAKAAMAAPKTTKLQKNIAKWEASVLAGKGGKKIPREMAVTAFAKHPGYSLKAVQGRFDLYDKRMESIEDDE